MNPRQNQESAVIHYPAVGSALSAVGSIQSTDRVGPSSKPEKTTTDRPVPALHFAGSAPCSGDLLPPARGRSSSDTARSARSTTGSRSDSRRPATPAVRILPRFLLRWLALRWPRSREYGVARAVPCSAPVAA